MHELAGLLLAQYHPCFLVCFFPVKKHIEGQLAAG